MKKIIKKIGDSKGIIFSKDETKIHRIEIGDIIDLTIKRIRMDGEEKCSRNIKQETAKIVDKK